MKHLHLPLHPPLFAAKIALFTRRVLAAVWVLLGKDSLLLAALQRLAAGAEAGAAPELAGAMLPQADMSSGAVMARAVEIKRMVLSL